MKRHAGFTIIEVMVAMVFLAVGLIGIAGLHYATIAGNRSANHATLAVTLAEDKIEELKRLAYGHADLADTDNNKNDIDADIKQNPSLFTNPDHDNDSPDPRMIRVWNVANDTPAPRLKTVTVIVGWEDNRWHYIALTTLIRNEG